MTAELSLRRPLPPRRPLPETASGAPTTAVPEANATIVGRADLGPAVATFRIRPDAPLPAAAPGQYFAIGVPVDGRLLQRSYSTSTGPGAQDELEFLVRRVPDGALTPRLWGLGVGDRLRLGRPKGLFTRIPGDRRTHLFVATGTGLAPFVAMVEMGLLEPDPPPMIVVHGVAFVQDLAYRERFERWQAEGRVAYIPSISRAGDAANVDWRGRTGRIDAILDDIWATKGLDADETVAYLCGNPDMLQAAAQILAGRGLGVEAIRIEQYWASQSARPKA